MMAETPTHPTHHHHPLPEIQPQKLADRTGYEQRNENFLDCDMEYARSELGSQSRKDDQNSQLHSSFTTAGFTSYSHQIVSQNVEGKVTMKNIHTMLQELYKAVTEKVVMENAAMYTALRAESAKVKKELEDLRREVRSTYLSKKVPSNVTLKNNAVDESSKSDPKSIPKTKTASEVNSKKPIDLLIPQTQVPERPITEK